jgi:hypothetical protein
MTAGTEAFQGSAASNRGSKTFRYDSVSHTFITE